MIFFKKVWPWNQFKRFIVLSTVRLKDQRNLFIRDFLEVFYFKVIKRDFWEVFLPSKCFQLLGIKSKISLCIILWLALGKPSFLANIVVEIRPGCRHLQRSLIMVNLSEILLGGMQ